MKRDSREKNEAMRAFKVEIKEWLTQHHLTKKWLADVLGVQHGTVRNWLSSEMRIGEETCNRIRDLMKRPSLEDIVPTPVRPPAFLLAPANGAKVVLWLTAAKIIDESVLSPERIRTSLNQVRGEQAAFAAWATPIINAEISRVLRAEDDAKIRIMQIAQSNEVELSRKIDNDIDNKVVIYVRKSELNLAFLKAAASYQPGKDIGTFVQRTLNQAAEHAISKDIDSFLNQGNAPEGASCALDESLPHSSS